MSEAELQKSVILALRSAGFWVVRLGVSRKRGSAGTQSGEKGMPDIMVLDAAKNVGGAGFLEIKTNVGKLSDAQLRWHAKALQRGVRAAVVRSVSEAMSVVNGWRRCG